MKKNIKTVFLISILTCSATLLGDYCFDRLVRDVNRTVDLYLDGTYTQTQYSFYVGIAYAEYDICITAPAY